MSLVNWIRWKLQPMDFARASASVVFPTPGMSSINRWPSPKKQATASRTASGFPSKAFSTFEMILCGIEIFGFMTSFRSITAPCIKNNGGYFVVSASIMTAFQAVVYGLVQGLTEFLPVSSSAHLILLPWFTGWPDPGLAFDVGLHLGTLVAAMVYFWQDILEFLKAFGRSLVGIRNYQTRLPWQIIAATVPGAVFGFLFEKQADTVFRSPLLIAGTLSALGVVLYWADRRGRNDTPLSGLTWFQ